MLMLIESYRGSCDGKHRIAFQHYHQIDAARPSCGLASTRAQHGHGHVSVSVTVRKHGIWSVSVSVSVFVVRYVKFGMSVFVSVCRNADT
jgi:hypothetical protein